MPAPGESAAEPERIADVPPEPARDGWALIALVPYDGREPPSDVGDEVAEAVWCAVSALWHPALLDRAIALPRVEPIESPTPPAAREVRVVPSGSWDRLPSGYRTAALDAGAVLIESASDRGELVRQILGRLGADDGLDRVADEGMAGAARDFLALGTVRWFLRELTTSMGHADMLDADSLTRELLAAAHAWRTGDWPGSVNRLRAAFEVLTQARERFYPVDAYVIDLCLLDPSMGEGVLAEPLATPVAISFLAPAQAVETQGLQDPARMAALRQAIADGWADVVGGTYAEAEDPLLPLESIVWQFRHGASVYRTYLEDRTVETYARRRFGLHAQLPQIAKRFGFRYALHLGFDAGRFPIPSETKRLWESPDGSSLESLMRPPLAADRPAQGWLLPWRLAATMKNDHVAALPLLHWPRPVASWYLDLRRVATYSPVLGRFTTLNDFFHLSDRPYETFRPESDQYVTPYLQQAVARRESQPVTRLTRHHRLRARLDAARTIQSLALAIAAASQSQLAAEPAAADAAPNPLDELETLIEGGRHAEAKEGLDEAIAIEAEALTNRLVTVPAGSSSVPSRQSGAQRPGFLVINPLSLSRRAAVLLPDAALDLRPEGSLRAAQFTDEGVYAVVDVPSFGFAWVPREPDPGIPPVSPAGHAARGRQIRNELMEVEIDAATGGIRRLGAVGEPSPRLGQQLVLAGFDGAAGKPGGSRMRSERIEIDYAGPALVQATSSGGLFDAGDGRRLASFVQRYRLWTGRPILEIDVTLGDLDPGWQSRAAQADPFSFYLACRWAWPDPNSMVRRLVFSAPELTEAERPESPEALDISTRTQRTALLFGGLCHHRKHGSRMLDTLLLAGAETSRSFQLGVVLDLEHPFHAAADLITPALVVPTDLGPPALGTSGWLVRLDHKAVAISHVGFAPETGDDRGWGLIFHLLETTGQSCRCRLRLFRNPTWARQVDFQGETIIDLTVQDDAVLVDLTPHELARVVVTLG
ncbi:MAG: glycosyl hydrolase family 38 [Isosphaeraceae bacterium]